MHVSAKFCREQEELQRERAISEPLESRRKVALAAEKAWRANAILAEERDAKQIARLKGASEMVSTLALETKAGTSG